MKNKKLISIVLMVTMIIGIFSGCGQQSPTSENIDSEISISSKLECSDLEASNLESSDDQKNYYIEEYENDKYYIISGDYTGEYDLQYLDLFEFQERTENDVVTDFSKAEIMNYSDYSDYCKNYHPNQKYVDENLNYVVFSSADRDSVTVDVRVADIECVGDTVTLYSWSKFAGTTADIASYVIFVPVSKDIKNLERQRLFDVEGYKILIGELPEPEVCADKPVIYLYPEAEQEITVSVDTDSDSELTCVYPSLSDGVWSVLAEPDGTLHANDTTYNYLYWEGESNTTYTINNGYCIKGSDTASFLEDKLAELGLTRKEANEFIVYWLPQMEDNKYNVISFDTAQYKERYKLNVSPEPDNLIRVFMTWYGTDKPVNILEPEVTGTPSRNGYTVVEWGGSKIKH